MEYQPKLLSLNNTNGKVEPVRAVAFVFANAHHCSSDNYTTLFGLTITLGSMLDNDGSYLAASGSSSEISAVERRSTNSLPRNPDNVDVSPSAMIEIATNTVIHKTPFRQ